MGFGLLRRVSVEYRIPASRSHLADLRNRPLIGGTFAKPHEHFPAVFDTKFWREFPYLLPCLIVAAFVALVIIITVLFFEEVSRMFDAFCYFQDRV